MYAAVVALPNEVVAEVGQIDRSHFSYELYMRWHDPVVKALEIDFSRAVPVGQFTGRYSTTELLCLETRPWATLSSAVGTCWGGHRRNAARSSC